MAAAGQIRLAVVTATTPSSSQATADVSITKLSRTNHTLTPRTNLDDHYSQAR
jgi:hypothetical protein